MIQRVRSITLTRLSMTTQRSNASGEVGTCDCSVRKGDSHQESDLSCDQANTGRRKLFVRLEGDSRPFRQLVEPHLAHVIAAKGVVLAVLAEKRS